MHQSESEQNHNPYMLDAAVHRLNNLVSALSQRIVAVEAKLEMIMIRLEALQSLDATVDRLAEQVNAVTDDLHASPYGDDAPYIPVGSRLSHLIHRQRHPSLEAKAVAEFLDEDLHAAREADTQPIEDLPFDGGPNPYIGAAPRYANQDINHPDNRAALDAFFSQLADHEDDDDSAPAPTQEPSA